MNHHFYSSHNGKDRSLSVFNVITLSQKKTLNKTGKKRPTNTITIKKSKKKK